MQEAIKKRPKIPLTNIILIDGGRLLDLIEKMRSNLPEEIRQAKLITNEREEILSKAKENAQNMINDAKEKAMFAISENEIVKDAQKEAKDIISRARDEELNIIKGADEYADDILSRMEEELNKFVIVIQKARKTLKNSSVTGSERQDTFDEEIRILEEKEMETVPEEENKNTHQEYSEEEYSSEEEYEEEYSSEEEYEDEYEEDEYEEDEYEEDDDEK